MDAKRWARINQLLDEAMDLEPEGRVAFLDEACLNDEALRREVESLLQAHSKAEPFLNAPALEVAARQLADETQFSLVGKQFGSYQVLTTLGSGGMGEVYLARDSRLGRKVALKILPRRFTREPDRLRRFEKEARVTSALNHPNIITIYDMGEMAGTYFIASEYVEGRTLRQLMGEGPIPVKDAIDICLQICNALAAAHDAGLVHRDVKPENVIVRPDGYIKVLDFGLVKLTEPEAIDEKTGSAGSGVATTPGLVLGTFSYMSPEQASGLEVDSRSDLFSLGVLMHELLTGDLPFKGDSSAATFHAILYQPPPPLATPNGQVSPELERIVTRALEKDRELRYQTASDLAAELKRLQRDSDSGWPNTRESFPRTEGGKPRTPAMKRQTLAVLMVVVLLLGILAIVLWLRRRAVQPSPWLAASFSRVTDSPHEELFPSLSPDGNTVVYARRGGDDSDIFSQRVGGFYTQNLTQNYSGDDTQPVFSPDGSKIAFRSERDGGGVFIMGASGESVRRLSDRGVAYHPAWSPDSQEVFYTEEDIKDPRDRKIVPPRLWAVNIKTLEKRLITTRDAAQPQLSPHGYRIAYWASDQGSQRDLWTMSSTGDDPVQLTDDSATDWNPVWSPDGKHLYFVSDRTGGMQVWRFAIDERTGRAPSEPELVPTPATFSQHVSLSRDGKRLVFSNVRIERNLYRVGIDPEQGEVISQPQALTQSSRQGLSLDISPDGKLLVYATVSGKNEDLAVLNSDGSGAPRWLTDDEYKDRGPRWSPDGKRIAFYSTRGGNFEIWLINVDGTGLRRLTESGNDKAYSPLWSPDGTRLNFTNNKGETWLIEVDKPWGEQTPRKLNPEREPALRFWPTAWSSDGQRLIGGSTLDPESPGLAAYSIASGRLEPIGHYDNSPIEWFQDERRALRNPDGALVLTDTKTETSRLFLSKLPDRIVAFTLSRDDRWLYYLQESREADIWLLQHK